MTRPAPTPVFFARSRPIVFFVMLGLCIAALTNAFVSITFWLPRLESPNLDAGTRQLLMGPWVVAWLGKIFFTFSFGFMTYLVWQYGRSTPGSEERLRVEQSLWITSAAVLWLWIALTIAKSVLMVFVV